MDLRQYWDSLSAEERAFEILQQTEAAVYIQLIDRILQAEVPTGKDMASLLDHYKENQ